MNYVIGFILGFCGLLFLEEVSKKRAPRRPYVVRYSHECALEPDRCAGIHEV